MSSFDDSISRFIETDSCELAVARIFADDEKSIYIEFGDIYDHDEDLANEFPMFHDHDCPP